MDFSFFLASLWTLAGLPTGSWLTLEKPLCMEKSLLGRKENQKKKRTSQAYSLARSQGDSSRTPPHVGLVTVPLQGCISALQDKAASLLQAAGTRTAWGSPAEDWQMVFLAHGSLRVTARVSSFAMDNYYEKYVFYLTFFSCV